MTRLQTLAGVGLAAVFSLAAVTPALASSNLIKDGSFEDVGDGTFMGSAGVAGWKMSGTVGDGYYPVAIAYNQISGYPTGAQGEDVPTDDAVSLSPDGPGDYGVYFVSDQADEVAIYQEIYLTPGSYDIGFDSYFTHNGFAQPGDATLVASIAGVQLADIDIAKATAGVWGASKGEAKILTAGDYLVSFTFNTPDSPDFAKDVLIDQAYVLSSSDGGGQPISAAPEPSTWALMIAGLGIVGAGLRLGDRRRASVSDAA